MPVTGGRAVPVLILGKGKLSREELWGVGGEGGFELERRELLGR